jgi:aspartate-semialdehyde dehydrogenase
VTRVPVQNGHTVDCGRARATAGHERDHRGVERVPRQAAEHDLPSAPKQPIVYLTENNRPQPALDANRDGG